MTLSTPTRANRPATAYAIRRRTPRPIVATFVLAFFLLGGGASYRLGAAFKYGDAYGQAPYATPAWWAVLAGTVGIGVVALTWIVWRLRRVR